MDNFIQEDVFCHLRSQESRAWIGSENHSHILSVSGSGQSQVIESNTNDKNDSKFNSKIVYSYMKLIAKAFGPKDTF